MRIIAIINQKGGVGKSTVTVNLGMGLAKAGKKVLLLDIDPQAHTSVLFCDPDSKYRTISDVLKDSDLRIEHIIRIAVNSDKEIANIQIAPSDIHLAKEQERLISKTYRERTIKKDIDRIKDNFDFILIDCPPALGLMSINAIYASDAFIIPITYSRFALDGVSDLFSTLQEVKENELNNISYRILKNMKDTRTPKTNFVVESQLTELAQFNTAVRKSEAINQALMMNKTIFDYQPKSYGVEDFESLTKETIIWNN
ncbi:MAG: AAA family ATPase [bacterium]|nr:AAA family ATPase [bacterium]